MKFIFTFILALMTVVRGDSSGEEVKAFWERELQSSGSASMYISSYKNCMILMIIMLFNMVYFIL